MKKIFAFLFIVFLIGIGVWYVKIHRTVKIVPTTSTYRNNETGIVFIYPKTLTVKNTNDTGDTVVIHHEVPFEHHDYCDFKGEATGTSPTLTDFNVALHVDNLALVPAIRAESPYIPAENFLSNQVIPSPGFIDQVTVGKLSGYKIFEGTEGCGQTTYYFPVGSGKTLVVEDDLITVFTGAIDPSQTSSALAVPGIISKTDHDSILNSILQTVSVN